MAIALDGSTPAGVSQTNGATATVVTGSFTPPNGSVLVACWQGNSATGNPAAPSISNTGGLTFSLSNWRSSGDSGGAHGQCAIWIAPSTGPGSMTVTVTSGSGSGDRQARLKVLVFTGVDTTTPSASAGEGTDSTGGLDTLTYTSTVANSLGVASVSDWDVTSSTFTAGAGTTVQDSASPGSAVNGATLTQTTPTTSGSSISLALTSPTSTQWNYAWVELQPGAAASASAQARPWVIPPVAVHRAATW